MAQKTYNFSWADRFALLDHYSPSDETACEVLGVTADELSTAKQLRAAGTFAPNKKLNVAEYNHLFAAQPVNVAPAVQPPVMTQTVHTKPQTATKRSVATPKKRGRKGEKIQHALLAVPSSPVPIETFMADHDVSLAVLRQAKRFAKVHGAEFEAKVGTINVRKDKATNQLMIWKS